MSFNHHTDEQLFQQIKKDDQAAFRTLFDRHYKTLLGTAVNILKNVDAAKDAVQDVFLQIWKKRDTLEVKTSFAAYLKRAVINRCFNQIKSQKPMVSAEQLEQKEGNLASIIDNLEAADLQDAIKKALDRLPERCRLIFVMKRMEDLSHKEIAEKLDISPKTIENQMTKALKVLRAAVQKFNEKKA